MVEKTRQVLVVEINILEVLLITADFLANNELLEVNETMFNLILLEFNVLLAFLLLFRHL